MKSRKNTMKHGGAFPNNEITSDISGQDVIIIIPVKKGGSKHKSRKSRKTKKTKKGRGGAVNLINDGTARLIVLPEVEFTNLKTATGELRSRQQSHRGLGENFKLK